MIKPALAVLALLAGAQDRAGLETLMSRARDSQLALEDRVAAIRDLRLQSQDREEAARLLRELASNGGEPVAVRRRAVQSLGWIVGNPKSRSYAATFDALKKIYEGDASPAVRAMALMALHFETHDPRNKAFRGWMLGIARDRGLKSEVRVGAAWALGTASTYPEVTAGLRRLVEDSSEAPDVRTQALKSLHLFMSRSEIWSRALDMAQDARLEVELREAATLFLWAAKSKEKTVEEALRRLADDSSDRIRKAAVLALDESLWSRPDILRYFRFRNDPILRRPFEVLELE